MGEPKEFIMACDILVYLAVAVAGANLWVTTRALPWAMLLQTFSLKKCEACGEGIDAPVKWCEFCRRGFLFVRCPMAIGTLKKCDPFVIPSTSHWTGAAIIEQSP